MCYGDFLTMSLTRCCCPCAAASTCRCSC